MTKGIVEKRGSRRRQIRPVVLIVTEGARTEPRYFEQFRTRKTNIDIHVVGNKSRGGATDYISLIRKAIEYRDKNQLSIAYGDAFWVVADGDVNFSSPSPVKAKNAQLAKARATAEKEKIQLAISNPCFEFWFLLHFRYTTAYLRDYSAVAEALRNHLPDYQKDSDVIKRLAPLLEDAFRNSARVEDSHRANGAALPFSLEVNPFTDVHRLVRSLIGRKHEAT